MQARRIALLIETSREYGRGLLRGVIRYQQEQGPWSIYFKPQGLDAKPPPWLSGWRGDGIIARINDRRMATAVKAAGVPAVDLRAAVSGVDLPVVGIENAEVVRLGVEHFLSRGFRNLGFCGTRPREHRYQDERCDRFAASVRALGLPCHVYSHPRSARLPWDEEQDHIAAWLKRLPKPVAVMCCHDERGQQVLDACRRADLAVPEQVAILGIDNDEFLCNLCTPGLSSIDVDSVRIGYEAARLLDSMMNGRRAPKKWLLFPPRGLVIRQSTDVTAATDPHIIQAARVLRENATAAVSVEQLLARISLSRSALFRRFKQQIGHSPKAEVTRLRMERAKDLLRNTTLPVHLIAERSGYSDAKQFITIFRKLAGTSPLRYRKSTMPTAKQRHSKPRKTDRID